MSTKTEVTTEVHKLATRLLYWKYKPGRPYLSGPGASAQLKAPRPQITVWAVIFEGLKFRVFQNSRGLIFVDLTR